MPRTGTNERCLPDGANFTRAASVALVVALAAACSQKSPAPAGLTAGAPKLIKPEVKPIDMPDGLKQFLGAWRVAEAKIAPWYDGAGANPDVDPEVKDKVILFSEGSVIGSTAVACKNARLTVAGVPADYLFQGSLKEPAKDAAALGFTSERIVSLNEECNSSTGDLEMDFPMVDKNTILLGLNNVVYTLKRVPQP